MERLSRRAHGDPIAEYYCHGRGRAFVPAKLNSKWEQDFRHIETDREGRKTSMDATWDCDKHNFTAVEWDLGVDLPDDDAEPVAGPAKSSAERDDVTAEAASTE